MMILPPVRSYHKPYETDIVQWQVYDDSKSNESYLTPYEAEALPY